MKADVIAQELPKALIKWYQFRKNSTVLYVTTNKGDKKDRDIALVKVLQENEMRVTCRTVEELFLISPDSTQRYDYIVFSSAAEYCECPEKLLERLHGLLCPQGRMLLGVNNRMGLRYFCGDRDPYTGRSFDGVENYRRAYSKKEDGFLGRMYTRSEWEMMLRQAGFHAFRFYSVLSDLDNPVFIYAEEYLPNEDLANRVFPTYNFPDSVFLEEESMYGSLIENGMFHQMANAYLIEVSMDGELSDVCHVTSSVERGREDALFTMIHDCGVVEKRAVYPEGRKRLRELYEHGMELKSRGISVVDSRLDEDAYVMPFIHAQVGQIYLNNLLMDDKSAFLNAMDHFRDLILQSSEIVKPDCGDGKGALLRKGYLDMVPLNSFYLDGEFVFYDQEFCVEDYPANVIIYRMVSSFYAGHLEFQKIIPMDELLERYHLKQYLKKWQKMEWEFLGKLKKTEELRIYHEKCRRNLEIVNANRQRMNYSEAEYQRLFVDIFKNVDNRKLILFGSGAFTERFLGMYGARYPVHAIIDNNENKWGQELEGILIQSPDILRKLSPDEYKVLICIKNYLSVARQLDEMGVRNYSIFDSGKSYPNTQPLSVQNELQKNQTPKKYHVGYVAGVFDLFHVGHVNLLRRAKELCDYLIVGVVSDEGVYKLKKRYPVISQEDRAEVLQSCRYADQVEVLPSNYGGIRDAYKMFHFDCQFSGDDHNDNIGWLADKEYLRKQGADIVFFPYTEKISTTTIRENIGK